MSESLGSIYRMNHESVMCTRYILSGGYNIGYQKLWFTGFWKFCGAID